MSTGTTARCSPRRLAGLLCAFAMAVAFAVGAIGSSAHAAGRDFVKYYVITAAYRGQPENLEEIADRFLGDAARAGEVFDLNAGRRQPDGGVLTDPHTLRAGWALVLPWDAVGDGVRYGTLPTTMSPPPQAPPSHSTTSHSHDKSSAKNQPSHAPADPASSHSTSTHGGCTLTAGSSNPTDWATLRLAASQAWSRSRGQGQLVAVVDSGVDGNLPQLAGHVAGGVDVVTGSGRGDTDCVGSGTAMASLIVAQPDHGGSVTGVAPDASVLPVRVVPKSGPVKQADVATAIDTAVSAGATVIALGALANPTDAHVGQSIKAAVEHGAVVVVAAPDAGSPANASPARPAGVLRVGGVGVNGQPADTYRPGAVDVVAPGINVSSLGVTGTGTLSASGTQYAVAFVAGEVALVRSAYPQLTPAQVTHRIEATADRLSDAAPDSRYGWGMISPAGSVTKVLPEESLAATPVAAKAGHHGSPGTLLLVVVALVGLVATVLVILRVRRVVRDPAEAPGQPSGEASDAGPDPGQHLDPAGHPDPDERSDPDGHPDPDEHRPPPPGGYADPDRYAASDRQVGLALHERATEEVDVRPGRDRD